MTVTVEDVYADKALRRSLRQAFWAKMGLNGTQELLEDVEQEFWAALIRRNVLERYDPEQSALNTYLHTVFIRVLRDVAMKVSNRPCGLALSTISRRMHAECFSYTIDGHMEQSILLDKVEERVLGLAPFVGTGAPGTAKSGVRILADAHEVWQDFRRGLSASGVARKFGVRRAAAGRWFRALVECGRGVLIPD